MLAKISALIVWALVAATLVFWGLRLFARPAAVPAHALPVAAGSAVRGDIGRLLGRTPVATASTPAVAEPALASRFRLQGIMAPKAVAAQRERGAGLALIAIDGKPARAFALGAALDGELVLQAVSLRSAAIGRAQGAALLTLELPVPAPPATGSIADIGSPPPEPAAQRAAAPARVAPVAPQSPPPVASQPLPPMPPLPRGQQGTLTQ